MRTIVLLLIRTTIVTTSIILSPVITLIIFILPFCSKKKNIKSTKKKSKQSRRNQQQQAVSVEPISTVVSTQQPMTPTSNAEPPTVLNTLTSMGQDPTPNPQAASKKDVKPNKKPEKENEKKADNSKMEEDVFIQHKAQVTDEKLNIPIPVEELKVRRNSKAKEDEGAKSKSAHTQKPQMTIEDLIKRDD